jgi:hypothetical protein
MKINFKRENKPLLLLIKTKRKLTITIDSRKKVLNLQAINKENDKQNN